MIRKKVFITCIMLVLNTFMLLMRSVRCERLLSANLWSLPSRIRTRNGFTDFVNFFTYRMRLVVTSMKKSYTSPCRMDESRLFFSRTTSSMYLRLAAFIFLVKRLRSVHQRRIFLQFSARIKWKVSCAVLSQDVVIATVEGKHSLHRELPPKLRNWRRVGWKPNGGKLLQSFFFFFCNL